MSHWHHKCESKSQILFCKYIGLETNPWWLPSDPCPYLWCTLIPNLSDWKTQSSGHQSMQIQKDPLFYRMKRMMSWGSSTRSETNGHLQVQVPTKGGGFGANYLLTRVCNVSELEKPWTQVCEWVSKVKWKRAPLWSVQPITSSLPKTWHVLMTTELCIDE